jgi:CRISPR-associated exonuclease Cas4
VRLASGRLGVAGRADVVEFHRLPAGITGVVLDDVDAYWQPFPVEYKRGKPKAHRADEVQLCAQAMCLEEAFDLPISEGALYYGLQRRRTPVFFDSELRELTTRTAEALHAIVRSGQIPVRTREKKCERCSLLPICLPPRTRAPRSAAAHTRQAILRELEHGDECV